MLRFAFLFLAVFSFFGCSGCVSNVNLHPVLPGPQLAAKIGDDSVALVSDFGDADPAHHPFCSAVWVGHRSILTANHCLEGYADMLHNVDMVNALIEQGMPVGMAVFFVKMGLADADPDQLDPAVKEVFEIIHAVQPRNPDTLRIPFVVQSEVVDIGVKPTGLHFTKVLARSPKIDLAVLEAVGDLPEHGVAVLADEQPAVGTKVASIGNVRGNYWFYREGVVGAYRHSMKKAGMDDVDGPFMQVSIPLSSGDSGSGIFSDTGELVGVGDFVSTEGIPGGYCTALNTVRGFLAGQHIVPLKLDPKADASLDD